MNHFVRSFAGLVVIVALHRVASADPPEIPLWPDGASGAVGNGPKDTPSITPFIPPDGSANGCAVVICPGGGYQHLAPVEGRDYAMFLNQHGITCFVLKYRLIPYHYPEITEDGTRAMRFVRANAGQWKIDPKRLGIIGSSAGGHLASTVLTHFDDGDPQSADPIEQQSCRPDFGVLSYPVISMQMSPVTHAGSRKNLLGFNPPQGLMDLLSNELQVKPTTPPCFVWCGADDKVVPAMNSILFAEALSKNKVPFELHIYEHARHGSALGDVYPYRHPLPWTAAMIKWLKVNQFIPEADPPSTIPSTDPSTAPSVH